MKPWLLNSIFDCKREVVWTSMSALECELGMVGKQFWRNGPSRPFFPTENIVFNLSKEDLKNIYLFLNG